MSGRAGEVARVKLGGKFSCPALSTLGIAILAVAAPLQAQSDHGLILAFPECDAWNPQDNYTPYAAFGGLETPAAAANGTTGAGNEAAPQSPQSNPLSTLEKPWDARDSGSDSFSAVQPWAQSGERSLEQEAEGNNFGRNSKESANPMLRDRHRPDRNGSIYYKNKLEFSLEGGWLPLNIPFPFDFLLGDGYNQTGLEYTLVPIIASVRWQLDDVGGPWILRGNWDVTASGSVTVIPRGPETRYFSYIMGIRRNFVPRRWKVAPYLDGQLGLGEIDAKGPLGVDYAQGQNFTFTLNLGSGVRYNLNPRYSLEAGMHYMHISNLYLSEPKFLNYGINVYGPWVGINIRFGKHRPAVE